MFRLTKRASSALRALTLGGGSLGAAAVAYRYRQVLLKEGELPIEPLAVFDSDQSQARSSQKKNCQTKITAAAPPPQRVLVLGGGVVGVTAAYKLAKAGHSVVVLEPNPEPGEECSACAAGGMQRSNPTVDRNTWIAVCKCLVPSTLSTNRQQQQSFQFFHMDWWETLSDPFFLRWLVTFTRTSLFSGKDQEEKQQAMLQFTNYAVDDMVQMMEDRKDDMANKSGYNNRGSVSVSYDDNPQPAAAAMQKQETETTQKATTSNPTSSKMSYEPSRQLLGASEILQVEPSLRHQVQQPTSAKYEYQAKSASSGRFTKELAQRCIQDPHLNVTILFNTQVKAIVVDEPSATTTTPNNKLPRISQLKTNRGVIHVPNDVHIVVAAGSWTPHVLALMDLYAPVYPLKGYAMSVSAQKILASTTTHLEPHDLPSRIVSDQYMYTSRLGDDEIRITSIGEFSGWKTHPTPRVDAAFRQEAIRQFPQLQEWIQAAPTRCGHRPYVNDGILLLGAVDSHDKLYVSCGPGSNGWKLAVGSGEIIERLVSGQSAQTIQEDLGFDVQALSPAGRVLKAPLFAKLCRARWNI